MSLPLIVNQKTAARLLGVSESTIWRWRQSGQIMPVPQFKTPKYSVSELQKLAGAIVEHAA